MDACHQQYVDGPEDAVDGIILETAGFLVQQTDITISIGMDYNAGRRPEWRNVSNIPWAYVVEMYVVEPPSASKRK